MIIRLMRLISVQKPQINLVSPKNFELIYEKYFFKLFRTSHSEGVYHTKVHLKLRQLIVGALTFIFWSSLKYPLDQIERLTLVLGSSRM